jgi:hypothetical protein
VRGLLRGAPRSAVPRGQIDSNPGCPVGSGPWVWSDQIPVSQDTRRENGQGEPAREQSVPKNGPSLPSENNAPRGITLRTPFDHSGSMREPTKDTAGAGSWTPLPDPENRYSSGIADFDRLLEGGFQRGSMALFGMDETVGTEDLDLLLMPTLLNLLYQSRGIVAVLPSRDSPHAFRARLTRYVTRRRFDSRVRVVDYVGEDEGPPYVVNLRMHPDHQKRPGKQSRSEQAGFAKMAQAEKAAQGNRKRPYLELYAFEVLNMLVGAEQATQMFFYGVKRARSAGNLVIGLLGPGLACAAAVRRMADTEFELRRDEVGLLIRGVRPSFSSYVVTSDRERGPPHVQFVPQPS